MSTRGAITRLHTLQTPSFSGRYVHWDCYPTGLGAELWQAYHGHFQDNAEAMLKVLLDDHPAGWSSLCGVDFSQLQAATDGKDVDFDSANAPICYCHGDRNEDAFEVTERNASGSGCEWVYAFAPSLLAMALPEKMARLTAKTLLVNQNAGGKASVQTIAASPIEAASSAQVTDHGTNTSNGSNGNGLPGHESVGTTCVDKEQKASRNGASIRNDDSFHCVLQPALLVFSSFTPHGDKMIGMFGCGDPHAAWKLVAVLDLEGPEPDWEQIEERGRLLPTSVLTNFTTGPRLTVGRKPNAGAKPTAARKPNAERKSIVNKARLRRRFFSR